MQTMTARTTGKSIIRKAMALCLAAVCFVTMSLGVSPAMADDGAGSMTIKLNAEANSPTSIRLTWTDAATEEQPVKEYRVYRVVDGKRQMIRDGVSDRSCLIDGLSPATEYTFYIEAWGEKAESAEEEGSSAVLQMVAYSNNAGCTTPKQIATVKGLTKTIKKKARYTARAHVSVSGTMGSPVLLQCYNGSKWVTKKTISTADTAGTQTVKVVFPNLWWKKTKTKWRYVVKAGEQNTEAVYGTVVLKTLKYYQNPERYVQIKNKISKHGHKYYTAPVLTNNMSTRKQHVEAMIKTARKYLGDPYVVCRSRAPGKGVDCSGLVMQACYGAGVDLWPSNPWRHRFPKYEYESRRIAKMKTLKTVKWKDRKRGDLIFYSRGGRVMHVAIYIGRGRIIHSSYPNVRISRAKNPTWGRITRVARVFN